MRNICIFSFTFAVTFVTPAAWYKHKHQYHARKHQYYARKQE